jgi:hypothetical protein
MYIGTRRKSEVMHHLLVFKTLSLKGYFLNDTYKNLSQKSAEYCLKKMCCVSAIELPMSMNKAK